MKQLSAADTRASQETDAEQPVDSGHVLDRAVDILELFVRIGPELGVSELSRALGLNKATAHRLLTTLKRRDLVSQDPVTRRYRLGMKLWELGSRATADFSWIDRVHPYLERLTAEMGETTHMAILEGAEILYVDKVETSRSLRMPSQVGRRLPAHCTALGKAMLAYLTDDVLDWVISRRPLMRATAKTINDPSRLRTELELIRGHGYAVDNEEARGGVALHRCADPRSPRAGHRGGEQCRPNGTNAVRECAAGRRTGAQGGGRHLHRARVPSDGRQWTGDPRVGTVAGRSATSSDCGGCLRLRPSPDPPDGALSKNNPAMNPSLAERFSLAGRNAVVTGGGGGLGRVSSPGRLRDWERASWSRIGTPRPPPKPQPRSPARADRRRVSMSMWQSRHRSTSSPRHCERGSTGCTCWSTTPASRPRRCSPMRRRSRHGTGSWP